MAEASALRRTVRGQPQQTEQDRTGKADQRWISRAEQQQRRPIRSGNGTEPRGGGMVLDPRGYESCQGLPALRIGSENSFTVPIQFPLRSNFLHEYTDPTTAAGGTKRSRFGSVGAFFMCISFPLIMRQHLLSSSGMRVRSAALLRAGPQSHFDCTKEMKAAWL